VLVTYHSFLDTTNTVPIYFEADVTGLLKSKLYLIDPQITQVVQEGIYNGLVPYQTRTLEASDAATSIRRLLTSIKHNAMELKFSKSLLLHGASMGGKTTLLNNCCHSEGFHVNVVDCYRLIEDTLDATLVRLDLEVEKTISSWPCVLVLKGFEALLKLWEGKLT
jgi:hypothetical protein